MVAPIRFALLFIHVVALAEVLGSYAPKVKSGVKEIRVRLSPMRAVGNGIRTPPRVPKTTKTEMKRETPHAYFNVRDPSKNVQECTCADDCYRWGFKCLRTCCARPVWSERFSRVKFWLGVGAQMNRGVEHLLVR
eukprot:972175-Amphidinium_carterae.1